MWTCPKCKESIEDQFDSCWKCAGEVQPEAAPGKVTSIKRVSGGFLLGLLVVVQVWLVATVTLQPVNLARSSFRRDERSAALAALAKEPSAENRAAVREEWRLAHQHVARGQFTCAGVLLAVCFGVEAVLVWLWRQHHSAKSKHARLAQAERSC